MAAVYDISGFQVFSHGDVGAAHAMAHRLLDQGWHQQGYDELGSWLRGRGGTGSDWVHLHWHMMVFELAVGRWHDAHARYREHILPAARTGDAVTDAPAGLWRLALAAPEAVDLPWSEVHSSALSRMGRDRSSFVVLHDLLALAGAGDLDGLDGWLRRSATQTREDQVLEQFAWALRCYAAASFREAAVALAAALAGIGILGGSSGQNELFIQIYRQALAASS